MLKLEPGDKCQREGCTHDATDIWNGDGGAFALRRSYMLSKWCRCCVLAVQLEHARERAKVIEMLERDLERACKR